MWIWIKGRICVIDWLKETNIFYNIGDLSQKKPDTSDRKQLDREKMSELDRINQDADRTYLHRLHRHQVNQHLPGGELPTNRFCGLVHPSFFEWINSTYPKI